MGVIVPLLCCAGSVVVSWPMFHADQRRQRQSECRTFLKRAFTAEKVEFADKNAYSTDYEKIGWSPEGHLRYAYFFAPDVVMTRPFEKHPLPPMEKLKAAMGQQLLDDLGPHGDCAKECWVTVACAGDIFEDGEIDVWSISTHARKDKYGIDREPGELINETAR